jgi:hypothetical protein
VETTSNLQGTEEIVWGRAKKLVRLRASVEEASEAESGMLYRPERVLEVGRPYSNSQALRNLLRSISGNVHWIERHAAIPLLDVVGESAVSGQHASFVIVREGLPDERLTRAATNLRRELAASQIDFDLVWLSPPEFPVHGPWVLAGEGVWSVPPTGALSRADEITQSSDPARVRDIVIPLAAQGRSIFGPNEARSLS